MTEVNITIIDREGVEHDLTVPTDMNLNLMEVCKGSDLPVEGTCGGMALCASCQVYNISDHDLGEKNPDEEDMLGQALHVKENSRLGCQLYVNDKMEGLVIELAPGEDDEEELDW